MNALNALNQSPLAGVHFPAATFVLRRTASAPLPTTSRRPDWSLVGMALVGVTALALHAGLLLSFLTAGAL